MTVYERRAAFEKMVLQLNEKQVEELAHTFPADVMEQIYKTRFFAKLYSDQSFYNAVQNSMADTLYNEFTAKALKDGSQ